MQNSVSDIVTFVLREGRRKGKKGKKEKEGRKKSEYTLACTYYKVITWKDTKEIGNTSFLGREPGTQRIGVLIQQIFITYYVPVPILELARESE